MKQAAAHRINLNGVDREIGSASRRIGKDISDPFEVILIKDRW